MKAYLLIQIKNYTNLFEINEHNHARHQPDEVADELIKKHNLKENEFMIFIKCSCGNLEPFARYTISEFESFELHHIEMIRNFYKEKLDELSGEMFVNDGDIVYKMAIELEDAAND